MASCRDCPRDSASWREPRQEAESRGQSLQEAIYHVQKSRQETKDHGQSRQKPNMMYSLCRKRKLAESIIPCVFEWETGTMRPEGTEMKKRHMYTRIHSATAHDWEYYKNKGKDIMDDGTMTFFWNAHTITVLVIFSCILVYVAMFEEPSPDSNYNMKRGITAMVLAFLLFGVTQTPDGPFKRPHPALWRLVLCLSIVYELSLVYLLFQTAEDARLVMKNFDKNLGKPLPERSYGGNCLIYDPDVPDNPFHMFWTLIIRDWWFCMIISVMFEILEYTLEHQLPNFSECWWDHWIMDALVCNGLGIYLGMKTLNYLSMKPYHWRGMWNISGYRGKMKRIALQFTPYSWTDFNWKPLSSLKRWVAVLGMLSIFLLAELNTFYLKFVLWIPPEHYLCLTRLVFFLFMGAAGLREGFQYLDDPNCKKFGRQAWVMSSIIITELLVTVKFGWETISKPIPTSIAYFWFLGFIGLVGYTIWKFYIIRDVKNDVVVDMSEQHNDEAREGVKEEKEIVTRLRVNNNNNVKGDGLHQRAKTKNGPSVL